MYIKMISLCKHFHFNVFAFVFSIKSATESMSHIKLKSLMNKLYVHN